MNFFLFFISIFLSSVGTSLDLYTTRIFTKDLGEEFEANNLARSVIKRWGERYWLLIEASVVMAFGIIDSMELPFLLLFLGLVWFVSRGLAGARNLQVIVEYRIIGINSFKEKEKSRRQAFQNVSFNNKLKLKLPYLIEILICLTIYGLLLTSSCPFISSIGSLILGLIIFFARIITL